MAEWKNNEKGKLDPAFAAIRSLFLDGTIDTMYKLIDHSPTKVAALFSMSYTKYQQKLREPWKFTIGHIMLLAFYLKVDPEVINRIIQKDTENFVKEKFELFKLKEQKTKEKLIKQKKKA